MLYYILTWHMAWVRSCCRISVYLFLSLTTPASCCLASSSTEDTWSSRCFNTFSLAWNCVLYYCIVH